MKMTGKFKKLSILAIAGLTTLSLVACEMPEQEVYEFKGKQYTEDQLEEVVESMIEMENPDTDFDVDISEDMD